MQDIIAPFYDLLCDSIDVDGVSIPNAVMLGADDKLTVVALALPPQQVYAFMLSRWTLDRAQAMIFGLDRFAKDGQGTTLGDLIAGHYFERGQSSRPFIVEYQHDPRIVQPIDWDNAFWNRQLLVELAGNIAELARPA